MRLTLFLDHLCNLDCSYCYNGQKFSRPMSAEVARRAVELVFQSGHKLDQLGFFGGEPLLHLPLMEQISLFAREQSLPSASKCLLVVTTNATLISQEAAARLKALQFHVGISLDGIAPAHNACRRYKGGADSHEAVERGLKNALAAGLPVKVISVVDPANVDFMADNLSYLLDLGVKHISININYEAPWNDEARERFKLSLRALADRYIEEYRQNRRFQLNILDAKIITHVKGGFSCGDRCDFGCEEWAVSPTGLIYPCDRLIGEDNREDVVIGDIKSGIDTQRRDALIQKKNALLQECMDCDLVHRCMHWCGCVNYAMTGSVGEVSGVLCWFEQTLIQEADRAAEILFEEKIPGFINRFYKHTINA